MVNPINVSRRDLNSKAFSNHYADVRRHTPAGTIHTDGICRKESVGAGVPDSPFQGRNCGCLIKNDYRKNHDVTGRRGRRRSLSTTIRPLHMRENKFSLVRNISAGVCLLTSA